MKLHGVKRPIAMFEAHDQIVVGPGGEPEAVRQGLSDSEGVIPHGLKGLRNAGEE